MFNWLFKKKKPKANVIEIKVDSKYMMIIPEPISRDILDEMRELWRKWQEDGKSQILVLNGIDAQIIEIDKDATFDFNDVKTIIDKKI